ncbi:cytochrome P450 2W1-like [Sceloporus undulatus]|uniref:cytochrome P450 2W1-like n=1 Tax=Sceloporus undulatus TaxID=8520 RepID=UPI001C4CF917|nr:cytochrome P450 2W1-like [Sceloporus undulatus]
MTPWASVLFSSGTVALLFALLLLTAFWFFTHPEKSSLRMPPGPPPLPIIGNLHLVDPTRQDISFMKLSEIYGPVFTVHLGRRKAVVLAGHEAVKEALLSKDNEFIERPYIPIFSQIQHEKGIFFSDGDLWKTTRRFTLSYLREFGMGKQQMEGRILEELHFLTEMVNSFKGGEFESKAFSAAPTNITFTVLFGDRFDYANPTFVTLLRLIGEVMSLLGQPFLHVFNAYPYLGFLLKPHKMILRRIEETCAILKKYIQAAKQSVSENTVGSYIDAMLLKQKEEEKSESKSIFCDANILASVLDLVMAGTETTATTLQWAILLMMKYPEIQRKVQEEIKRVLGSERGPTYEDKKHMPFATAVIHEVQRFASVVPQFPRCTAVDTHFRGYFIPKGTMVIASFTSVLYDQTQWETPNKFNPNHFLDGAGNFVAKEAFVPFSIGRRNCAGESLAKMELFLFFVGLLQKFTFRPPPEMTESDLDLTVKPAFTRRPQPYSTCAVPCD